MSLQTLEAVKKIRNCFSCPIVVVWKYKDVKCNLSDILNGKLQNGKKWDGRALTGLESRIERLEGKGASNMLLAALRNYQSVAKMAVHFSKADLGKMPTDKLEQALTTFQEHRVVLPARIKIDLLKRRSCTLMEAGMVQELLQAMDLFSAPSEFNPFKPTLAALDCTFAAKLETYNACIFDKLAVQYLNKGRPGTPLLYALAHEALQAHASLDAMELYELGEKVPSIHAEHCCVWHAILAIGNDSIDVNMDLACKVFAPPPMHVYRASEFGEHLQVGKVGCFMTQADVNALIAAKSNASRSPLPLIASTMHAQPWWSQQLATLGAEAVGLQEWASKIAADKQCLQSLQTCDSANLNKLLKIVESLGSIKMALKSDRVAPYFEMVRFKIEELVMLLLEGKHNPTESMHEALSVSQKLLHEMTITFPYDPNMKELLESVGNELQAQNQTTLKRDLLVEAGIIEGEMAKPEANHNIMLDALLAMHRLTAAVTSSLDNDKEFCVSVKSTWWHVLNFVARLALQPLQA
eukprot:2899074-Amphidinium_carterae.2